MGAALIIADGRTCLVTLFLHTKTNFSFHLTCTVRYCNYLSAFLLSAAGLQAAGFAVPFVCPVCGAVLQVFGCLWQNVSEHCAVCYVEVN